MNEMVRKRLGDLVLGIDRSLVVGILCGCLCVFIDIDHPIALAIGIEDARFLHPYYFILACLIVCGVFAYVGGLLLKAVLRKGYA